MTSEVASEPGEAMGDVTIVNTTDLDLVLVLNGVPQGPIAAGEERVVGQYQEGTTFGRLIARIPDGDRIFTPWVTWDFLVERDFRLEIVDTREG